MQDGIQIDARPFTQEFKKRLHALDNWRIEFHLKHIERGNDDMVR